MNSIYFDCFAGASGDMILGALLDLGAPLAEITGGLGSIGLEGAMLRTEPTKRGVIGATRAIVEYPPLQRRRNLAEISALISNSALPERVRRRSISVFENLARAEAKVHRKPVENVHFHEVGAVDAIFDIVGSMLALELLEVDQVYSSALPAGAGFAKSEHGVLPVPAPATLELIAGAIAPMVPPPAGVQHEMVTPTGAAILTTLARFEMPSMRVNRVGYGAGGRDLAALPNVLRVWLGETEATTGFRVLSLLETNLDDINPELLPHVLEQAMAKGARDAWLTPILMKKGRAAFTLSLLMDPGLENTLLDLLLTETTTLGARLQTVSRFEARRETRTIACSVGEASVKVRLDSHGRVTGLAPEFEDCRRLAGASGKPLAEIYRIISEAAWSAFGHD